MAQNNFRYTGDSLPYESEEEEVTAQFRRIEEPGLEPRSTNEGINMAWPDDEEMSIHITTQEEEKQCSFNSSQNRPHTFMSEKQTSRSQMIHIQEEDVEDQSVFRTTKFKVIKKLEKISVDMDELQERVNMDVLSMTHDKGMNGARQLAKMMNITPNRVQLVQEIASEMELGIRSQEFVMNQEQIEVHQPTWNSGEREDQQDQFVMIDQDSYYQEEEKENPISISSTGQPKCIEQNSNKWKSIEMVENPNLYSFGQDRQEINEFINEMSEADPNVIEQYFNNNQERRTSQGPIKVSYQQLMSPTSQTGQKRQVQAAVQRALNQVDINNSISSSNNSTVSENNIVITRNDIQVMTHSNTYTPKNTPSFMATFGFSKNGSNDSMPEIKVEEVPIISRISNFLKKTKTKFTIKSQSSDSGSDHSLEDSEVKNSVKSISHLDPPGLNPKNRRNSKLRKLHEKFSALSLFKTNESNPIHEIKETDGEQEMQAYRRRIESFKKNQFGFQLGFQLKEQVQHHIKSLEDKQTDPMESFTHATLEQSLRSRSKLSFKELKKHMKANHAMKTQTQQWQMCLDIGHLFMLNKKRKIPKFMKDIGLGPAIYLLLIKSLAKLFLLLAILNLPVMFLYSQGDEKRSILQLHSLGNLGQNEVVCQSENLARFQEKIEMSLQCKSGKMQRIIGFGLNKDESLCKIDTQLVDQTQPTQQSNTTSIPEYTITVESFNDCSSQSNETLDSNFSKSLVSEFEKNCQNKKVCKIPLKPKLLNPVTSCYKEVSNRLNSSIFRQFQTNGTTIVNSDQRMPEPIIQVLVECKSNSIYSEFLEMELDKKTVNNIVQSIDALSMIIVFMFSRFMMVLLEDFAIQYESETIYAKHFTLKIKKLPGTFKRYKDEIYLMFALWNQITQRINMINQNKVLEKNIDPTIIDINFGLKDYKVYSHFKIIQKHIEKIEILNLKLIKRPMNERLKDEITLKRNSLRIIMDEYDEECGKYNGDNSKKGFYDRIEFVFMTFREKDTMELVKDLLFRKDGMQSTQINKLRFYNTKTAAQKTLIKLTKLKTKDNIESFNKPASNSGIQMMKELKKNMQTIIDQEIQKDQDVKTATTIDPEFIQWENVGFTAEARLKQKLQTVGIAAVLILVSGYMTTIFNRQKNEVRMQIQNFDCGTQEYTKMEAYIEVVLNERTGGKDFKLMECFCQQELIKNPTMFLDISFEALGDQKINFDCRQWASSKSMLLGILFGTSMTIVFINFLAQLAFVWASKNERPLNRTSQNKKIFFLIFIQSLINSAIIFTFNNKFLDNLKFNSDWYLEDGSSIILTLCLLILSSQGTDFMDVIMKKVNQFLDRGCSFRMTRRSRKRKGEPRTKKFKQKELNELYSGTEIEIGFKLAYVYTFIFVCLMYSYGIPILYLITFVYFAITYWFEKLWLLRFYKKTREFDEKLPIKSLQLINYALLLHFLMSFMFMFSSNILDDFDHKEKQNLDPRFFPGKQLEDKFTNHIQDNFIGLGSFGFIMLLYYFIQVLTKKEPIQHLIERIQDKFLEQGYNFHDHSCDSDSSSDKMPTKLQSMKSMLQNSRKMKRRQTSPDEIEMIAALKSKKTLTGQLDFIGQIDLHHLMRLYEKNMVFITALLRYDPPDQLKIDKQEINFRRFVSSRYAIKLLIEAQVDEYISLMEKQVKPGSKIKAEKAYNYGIKQLDKNQKRLTLQQFRIEQRQVNDLLAPPIVLCSDSSCSQYSESEEGSEINRSNSQSERSHRKHHDHDNEIDDIPRMVSLGIDRLVQQRQAEFIQERDIKNILTLRNSSLNRNLGEAGQLILKKLGVLMDNFESEQLRKLYLTDNLRCKSLIQSYNFYDNHEYLTERPEIILKKASLMMQNPIIIGQLKQIKEDSSLSKIGELHYNSVPIKLKISKMVIDENCDREDADKEEKRLGEV